MSLFSVVGIGETQSMRLRAQAPGTGHPSSNPSSAPHDLDNPG